MPRKQRAREKKISAGNRDASPQPVESKTLQARPQGDRAEGRKSAAPSPSSLAGRLNMGHYFLIFLLILVLAACFNMVSAYSHTIIFAIILALVFSPFHRRILRLTRGRKEMAALLSCLGLTLVVVLPLLLVFLSLIHQGIESFNAIHTWINAEEYKKILEIPVVAKILTFISPYLPDLSKFFPEIGEKSQPLNQTILDVTSKVGTFLVNQGGGLMGNFGAFVGKCFLMLFTFFFIIRDEKKIFSHLLHLIPLHSSDEEKILAKVKAVSRSVLLGTFLTALAQGTAGGLAFWLTGLPGLFWGTMMAFAALIPFVGTALIWLPAAGYLLFLGKFWAAAFMLIWGVVVVGMMDNVLRPMFMQGSADMSTLLIFFAILGGLNTFGMIGLLYGPILFGLAMVLLYIYEMEFEPFLSQQDHS